MLSWINSFLTGRLQWVTLNSVYSEWSSVVSGVPQGSVLGPVLLYVNDILSIVNSHLLLFADDIKLYHSIKSENDIVLLQEDIDKLFSWLNTWLLSYIPKCKILHIHWQVYPTSVLHFEWYLLG